MNVGFDNDRYIELQAQRIRERAESFGGKLYLEIGGKIFDDYHASRVLPGFEPDSKLRMLKSMSDDIEILLAINANHIERSKVRGDLGITYDDDLLRLMDAFRELGFLVGGVVITMYAGQPAADGFRQRLRDLGVATYVHYPIEGYPYDVDRIVSEQGFGRNEFARTTRPLVVVCAPGPGSGKMATCLSQLYHEHEHGVRAGYAKFETFPVWNLPLDHPVNIAYEAATVDLADVNAIDPFHLEAYGRKAVNYNRDIEAFPVLRAMLERMLGESPYESPTDMGVNMAGFAIIDDGVVRDAARREIVRRYFKIAEEHRRSGLETNEIEKAGVLMKTAGITVDYLPAHSAALAKAAETGSPAGAIELPDGRVVCGRTSELLGAASSVLLNAMKAQAGIPDETLIIDDAALEPICDLRTSLLGHRNPRLHPGEMLIALSSSTRTSELAAQALAHLPELAGCDAFFSVILSEEDERLLGTLGINVSCEPRYERKRYYHD